MNRLQFRPGLSMFDRCGTEPKCEDAVFAMRRPLARGFRVRAVVSQRSR